MLDSFLYTFTVHDGIDLKLRKKSSSRLELCSINLCKKDFFGWIDK